MRYNFIAVLLLLSWSLFSQEKPTLSYYLPANHNGAPVSFDPNIPTPASVLGYEVGEWHVSHDQLVGYMRELDRASDRIQLLEYGRSHERRPMLCLLITAPANQRRLDVIRNTRRQLADPGTSAELALENLPAVLYAGYSIHGNEASGSNAALVVAYYLAAAQGPDLDALLNNTVILLDPCFNPDGLQRFSSWVNSRRALHGSPDPAGDEYNEPWPRGRTNHYWFDLNRDWLVAQQPESEGRVRLLQAWKPNVLTDHHEMGSNSTFFFQPGVASRVHPLTPARNQELTAKIAGYHAAKLSRHNILFYTGENFDDFYYGKGSTYPDVNGGIGILFEQASSRGSAQSTENGLLTFPYTVRNQVLSSLSTLQAVQAMRVELNTYLRDFYRSALDEALKDAHKGYLFAAPLFDLPAQQFLHLLSIHNIQAYPMPEKARVNGKTFEPGESFYVPLDQPQYRLLRAMFDRPRVFSDSIFYDISAWTLPDAFGLAWTPVTAREFQPRWVSLTAATPPAAPPPLSSADTAAYAFVIPADLYEQPRILASLHAAGIWVKAALKPFSAGGRRYEPGSLLIPADKQPLPPAALRARLRAMLPAESLLGAVGNGLTPEGPDLGSNNFPTLRPPKALLVTGEGVNPADAGEAWHLFDVRYGQALTLVEADRLGSLNLANFNVIILPEGSYNRLPAERLREFVTGGGTIVASGTALRWLQKNNLAALSFRNTDGAPAGRRPYGSLSEDRAALSLPGAIFEAEIDRTHPLCFGYKTDRLPMFLSDTIFIETTKNPYATPAVFTAEPLLAGYLHTRHKPLAAHSAAVVVCGLGRGRIIGFAGSPNFRAFWYGTNRLLANAVFFGQLISGEATERRQ